MGADLRRELRVPFYPAIQLKNHVRILSGSAAPTSGTSGTGAGKAGPGSEYRRTNGSVYTNTNTQASPTWTLTSDQAFANLSGDVTAAAGGAVTLQAAGADRAFAFMSGDATVAAGGAVSLAANKIKTASGTILAAAIIGTSAGQLGHANGVELVAAGGAHVINELVSAILINDYATAAYTDGGNTTINIGGGGAALTGLVSNANFIQAAADKVIMFVPLAATFLTLTENTGINLVTAAAPTNPGTAAGVFRYIVTYRQHATGL